MYIQEKVNTKRQIEFDIMKTMAIVFMVVVHVYEELYEYTLESFVDTGWENVLFFVAGPLGAPVFMFSMGVGIVYTKSKTAGDLFKRGIGLFALAYALNICREVIPYLIGCAINGSFEVDYLLYLLLNVDILMFAGLAFMFTALTRKLGVSPATLVLIGLILQPIGTLISESVSLPVTEHIGYLFGLFFYANEATCFPFFSWYIYPAMGIFFAKYLRHIEDTDKLYKKLFGVSTVLLVVFIATLTLYGFDIRAFYDLYEDACYRQTFLHVIFTALVILFVASCSHFLHKLIHFQALDRLIHFMSSNLNYIYIIQWIILGWLWFGFGVDIEGRPLLIIPISIAVILASVAIASVYVRIKKGKTN